MKKVLINSLSLLFILILTNSYSIAQYGVKYPEDQKLPIVKIYDSGKIENFKVKAKERAKADQEPTAVFAVTYNGFTEDAKTAFAKAVELWSYLVHSDDTIRINATWKELDQGVLGSCGPGGYFRNFKNAPIKNTWYPVVIANKLAGFDLDPDNADMNANFSSVFNWYLGTDGNCPSDQYDFISVVMHEIGHGLGFIGSGSVDGTEGSWGYNTGFPFIYDHFVVNNSDQELIDTILFANPSDDLETQLTSNNLFFKSDLSDNANGSTPSSIYVPSTWAPGSSYSHLGEIFNATDNSMMTFSSGYAEVTHDPGSVTLAIFAEMGWINTRFDHKHIKDMEVMSNPVTVSTEIFGDSAIYSNSVFLHYSADKFATDNKELMSTSNDTLFTFDIPVQASDTVWYYFEAKNTLDRTYYYPSQGKFEVSSIDTTLYFIIGDDNIDPEILYEKEKHYIFDYEKTFDIRALADDNMGIDSVYVEYKINDNASKYLNLQTNGENPAGLPKYNIDIPLSSETLNDLDTLYYKLVATDVSSNSNTTILPETGYFKVSIQKLFDTEIDTIINFDHANDENLFIYEGLSTDQPTDFNSIGLHSPHPYEEGKDFPSGEVIYSATLKVPIKLTSKANIVYDEIVIVEPGNPGTSYGDQEFWDYVIVEGSIDSGKTWHEFTDGYDCQISTAFTAAFNSGSTGTSSMYETHKIDLLENQKFAIDDEVLIRFKLWSDEATAGWGLAIDNIKIQKDAVNPSTPQSLEIVAQTGTTADLRWISSTDNVGVTGYNIYKDDELVDETTDTTYNATGLIETTQYSFYVKAKDAMDNLSEVSNTVYVNSTGIGDKLDNNLTNIKLYPNPTNGYVNVELTSDEIINELEISIYGIDGKLFYSSNKTINSMSVNENINVENFNSGIYILRINTGKNIITKKLFIK